MGKNYNRQCKWNSYPRLTTAMTSHVTAMGPELGSPEMKGDEQRGNLLSLDAHFTYRQFNWGHLTPSRPSSALDQLPHLLLKLVASRVVFHYSLCDSGWCDHLMQSKAGDVGSGRFPLPVSIFIRNGSKKMSCQSESCTDGCWDKVSLSTMMTSKPFLRYCTL